MNKFPDESVQNFVEPWWEPYPEGPICRGQLVWALVPFVDQVPRVIENVRREKADEHSSFVAEIKSLHMASRGQRERLNTPLPFPVAAIPMPKDPKAWFGVYEAKVRPCLVLSTGGELFSPDMRKMAAGAMPAPSMLVAPYYGADQNGRRAGVPPGTLELIRRVTWPQYMADMLPAGGSTWSILRLDQTQPLGAHHQGCDGMPHRLSRLAMRIVDEWLFWLLTNPLGSPPPMEAPSDPIKGTGFTLGDLREELQTSSKP